MEPRTSAKDFFLHLGTIVMLYAAAISFVNLLFTVVNKAYPAVTPVYYGYYSNSYDISLPVATLIIVFPIFLLLSWLLEKSYLADPSKKEIWVRRWLVYITLFVAGLIFVGDLVSILYKFLSGEDFTTAFILKALTVLAVTGFVFGYYLQDVRNKVTASGRKTWSIASSLVILAAIILGFSIIGSPRSQRLIRYDTQKVNDLQNIQGQIIDYWRMKGALPADLSTLNNPTGYFSVPLNPQTQSSYIYKVTGDKSFQLCAQFNKSADFPNNKALIRGADYWGHPAGQQCFDRTIDESIYPVYKPASQIIPPSTKI